MPPPRRFGPRAASVSGRPLVDVVCFRILGLTYIYIHTHTHIFIHIYIYIHIYIHTHLYTYIYTYHGLGLIGINGAYRLLYGAEYEGLVGVYLACRILRV